MKFEFLLAEKATWPIAFMCERLEVSKRGFSAWCADPIEPLTGRRRVAREDPRRARGQQRSLR